MFLINHYSPEVPMSKSITVAILLLAFVYCGFGQVAQEKVDTSAISKIKDEGFNRSQVMDLLSTLSDVYGPRLTGSPGFKRAAEWARQTLGSWGLENAHLEAWGPFGRGWSLKHYSANVIGTQVFPLISYPKAWSPGTGGEVTAEIVYFDAKTDSAIAEFKGKLKGKFVRSEEHTSELQSQFHLVCRLLLEKKKQKKYNVQYFNNYT